MKTIAIFSYKLIIALILLLLNNTVIIVHANTNDSSSRISIAITMICRNEEVNFRKNLKSWLPVIDHFIFMIDIRTTDNSIQAIMEILHNKAKYKIINYIFDGFGSARTASLQRVWEYYPYVTHVLIADPDWLPDTSTLNLSELDLDHDVFRFTAYDR